MTITEKDALCVEKEGLRAGMDALVQEHTSLQVQHVAVLGQRDTLATENEKLCDEMSGERAAWAEEKAALSGDGEALASRFAAAVKEQERLSADYDTVSRGLDALRKEKEAWGLEQDRLCEECDALTTEREAWKEEKRNLRKEWSALSSECEVWMEEKAQLCQERDSPSLNMILSLCLSRSLSVTLT